MQAVTNVIVKGKPNAGFRSKLETEVDKACSGLFISSSYYSCIALAVFEVSNPVFLEQLFRCCPNEIVFSAHTNNNRLVFKFQITSNEVIQERQKENDSGLSESLALIKSICDSVFIDEINQEISLVFDILSFTNNYSFVRTKLLRTYFDYDVINKETVK